MAMARQASQGDDICYNALIILRTRKQVNHSHLPIKSPSYTLFIGVFTYTFIPFSQEHMNNTFDVIVVGGGHAGVEAAYAAAKLGSKTLLITLKIDKVATMPCNPSIGGLGKGHIVFEISALGGLMPQLCSKTYLQARMLNTRKGPAVQGLRLQIDKFSYSQYAKEILLNTPNLTIVEDKIPFFALKNSPAFDPSQSRIKSLSSTHTTPG